MKEKRMKTRWMRLLAYAGFLAAGVLGGYLYYRLAGCNSGTCAIWSSPVNSTVYGEIFGLLVGMIVLPDPKKKANQEEEPHA